MGILHDHTLIARAGVMGRANLEANIAAVRDEYVRNGLCVMVVVDDQVDIAGPSFVPNAKICLTTPRLLDEHGITPEIEATNDLGNVYQHTLWLAEGEPSAIVDILWVAFRGPFPKEEVSRDWTTDDLRGLRRPGP